MSYKDYEKLYNITKLSTTTHEEKKKKLVNKLRFSRKEYTTKNHNSDYKKVSKTE